MALPVTFSPPLFLQRQAWLIRTIRQESPSSLLDIGCGEGALLACLSLPSSTLPYTLPPYLGPLQPFDEIHLKRIAGLDLSADDLASAITETAPSSPPDESHTHEFSLGPMRWEETEVNIYHGDFQDPNPSFIYSPQNKTGYECIVSTEVIEHLEPDTLPLFAPILLGHYRPRLLLLTTPNYTYNQRFTPPHLPSPSGIPDPTHRTDRMFRHPDHKFEWTEEEWRDWCVGAAERWGYEVEIGGVGKCVEVDEWGRDESIGYASQTALFRLTSLLAHHIHTPHPSSRNPHPAEEILEGVRRQMKLWNVAEMTVQEVWAQHEISILCGGDVVALLDAIHNSSNSSNSCSSSSDPSGPSGPSGSSQPSSAELTTSVTETVSETRGGNGHGDANGDADGTDHGIKEEEAEWEIDTSNKKKEDTIWEIVLRNKKYVPEERTSVWTDAGSSSFGLPRDGEGYDEDEDEEEEEREEREEREWTRPLDPEFSAAEHGFVTETDGADHTSEENGWGWGTNPSSGWTTEPTPTEPTPTPSRTSPDIDLERTDESTGVSWSGVAGKQEDVSTSPSTSTAWS
ncbi:hypothetical protein SISNIDRAFT_442254 [Sistotremastrum niveocremeum HHB9708]|uniref:Small RNA 2'-O-methyltransferase n=1 Tax=Sistotremastrum niveocremeum HHB9708 TaxID=1314777 RepID=A0A164TL81_9AGAM|nr:hypothetical protein SISNIDRAFT_442254 [Sistotremastrum niveocremeum HHB9708]